MGLHNTRPGGDARARLNGATPRRINGLAGMGSSAAVAAPAPESTGWAWAAATLPGRERVPAREAPRAPPHRVSAREARAATPRVSARAAPPAAAPERARGPRGER